MGYSVSVIVPCYNSSRFIKKALDSVLNQSRRPEEVIGIDDGSTDNTRSILEGYSPDVRILCHQNNSNLGVGASMNLGVRESKGDLIAFLDHDDLWHSTKLSEQVKTFDKYPDVGLVYTNVSVIDEDDKELFKVYPNGFRELNKPEELLLKCYIITVSSVMVRRKLFDKIGVFRTDVQSADHDMWLRMIEKAKCFYLPKCLASHRRHPSQISSGRKIWEDGFVILREAYKRYPYGATVKRKRLAVLNYRLGEYDWNHKLYWKGTKHFLLAGMFDPFRGAEVFISSLSNVGKRN